MRSARLAQGVIIVVLLIALGFTSTAAFAYWQDVTSLGNVQIEFSGEDATLEIVELHETFTGKLVPEGRAYFTDEVEEVVLQYQVSISRELARTMNLIVEATQVLIEGDDTYAHLVEITIDGSKNKVVRDIFNELVVVTVTVRLIEPIDAAEAALLGLDPERVNVEDSVAAYHAIKGKTVTITLGFGVQPKTNGN
ncbi:MAG: hypothetical protein EA375_04635 [Acholeplasmataceae bacterium]|nr:MAG: hypothetical protein EA375_04635 [Acholeplasmataceae bacterium]